MFRQVALAVVGVGLCIGGCSAPRPAIVITNPDPSGKIPAMKKAVRERDMKVVRQLIKDLDSDDPAVRMFAIHSLEELTGERYGYSYFHDDLQRKTALQSWKQWLAQQEGKAPSVPGAPTTKPADESRLVGGKPGE